MSVIPEVVLHKAVVAGLRKLREEPTIVDSLFKNLDARNRMFMKKFIQSKSIDISFNYPMKQELQFPALVFLLKNESEAQSFLGDHMGESPNYDVPDHDMVADTLGGHGGSISTMQNLPRMFYGGLSVTESYVTSGEIQKVSLNDDDLEDFYDYINSYPQVPSLELYVVSGTGAGQVATISSILDNVLDLSTSLDVQLDTTSVIDLRLAVDTPGAVGHPPRVFEPSDASVWSRLGANFQVQYQISVLASDQYETIYLYNLVKAILFTQRKFLEGQGLQALEISGSDFAPRTEFLPVEAFQRVISVTFVSPFALIQEEDAFTSIRLNVAVQEAFEAENSDQITFDIQV